MKDDYFDNDWYSIWDLKYTLADFILPRLQLFRDKWEKGEMQAIPDWVSSNKELTYEEYKFLWIEMLGKMIRSFQALSEYLKVEIKGEKLYNTMPQDELDEGFFLFGKYFEHLWD